MITFVSKTFGGRTSDTHITRNSGFLNLSFTPGDMVMADKGFPTIDIADVILVTPPKKQSGKQFTKEELESCERIASVRIHVERVIQRLKLFNILTHRFSAKLFSRIDKIVHLCAVLVNLQTHVLTPDSDVSESDVSESENIEFDLDSDDSLDY